jgi:predicted double-glycine peptidase
MRTNPFPRARPRRARIIDDRAALTGLRAAAGAVAVGLLLSACASSVHTSTTESAFAGSHQGFAYAEVEVVKQSEPRSCGLAVLACVLRYWDRPVTEAGLLAKYPVRTGQGHSLQTLQGIAQDQGLLAFALSLRAGALGSPAAQLSEQIAKGRPVIVAVRLPQGRYFGEPVPVLGTLDARTVRPFGLVPSSSGEEYKLHYVVVFGEDATRYLLMDPAYGILTVPRTSLLQWWSDLGHAALLCSPPPTSPPSIPTSL